MILTRKDLEKLVPITAEGKPLEKAFEVDTETKTAKCLTGISGKQRWDIAKTIPGCPEHPRMSAPDRWYWGFWSAEAKAERQSPTVVETFDHLESIVESGSIQTCRDPGWDSLCAIEILPDGRKTHRDIIRLDTILKTGIRHANWDDPNYLGHGIPTGVRSLEDCKVVDAWHNNLPLVEFHYDYLARTVKVFCEGPLLEG